MHVRIRGTRRAVSLISERCATPTPDKLRDNLVTLGWASGPVRDSDLVTAIVSFTRSFKITNRDFFNSQTKKN